MTMWPPQHGHGDRASVSSTGAASAAGGATPPDDPPAEPIDVRPPCPCCGGHMVIIETFERWRQPRAPPVGTVPTGIITP